MVNPSPRARCPSAQESRRRRRAQPIRISTDMSTPKFRPRTPGYSPRSGQARRSRFKLSWRGSRPTPGRCLAPAAPRPAAASPPLLRPLPRGRPGIRPLRRSGANRCRRAAIGARIDQRTGNRRGTPVASRSGPQDGRRHGLDLGNIPGTGSSGRVTKSDAASIEPSTASTACR
jgi:pyruvate/2-oxoglutarate dehydrogenase complex dihydrolipoamide acyltransferase (E2) component